MRTNHLVAALAIERCRHGLSHLCAVAHLAGSGELQEKTVRSLLRAMNAELNLIEESLDKDISATRD
jgi:hypothetical protein